MTEVLVAIVGALQVVAVAYLEINRRQGKKCGSRSCTEFIRDSLILIRNEEAKKPMFDSDQK